MKMKLSLMILAVFNFLCTGTAVAGPVDVPNIFQKATPAIADSVNENFAVIEFAVDDNASMISSLQNAHTVTRTGYISIPGSAFQPRQDGYSYNASGNYLLVNDAASVIYFAPLNLPQGATIVRVTGSFYDNSTVNPGPGFSLSRVDQYGAALNVAIARTFGQPGDVTIVDDTINYPVIDNVNYSYPISVMLVDAGIRLYRVLIEYQYTLD